VDRLSTDPAFAKVAVFRVDFDSSKDVLRQLNVHHQATVIGFKGKTEKARSVNDGRLEEIRKVFEGSL
jgi:thioredoxin 1